jgi:CRISPR-associated protein (TIGR02584 family)
MAAFRDIVVAVAGLTPQVITETLYYLTQVRQPPVLPAEMHVLTTLRGQERLRSRLLAPAGHFPAFCAEYGLEAARICFEVHLLRDAAQAPLDDIRTAADSAAVADQIAAVIRRLTRDPTTRLHCSLAGGRKTQSVLLGFALQLYGRPQDTLLHVLVDEAFQHHPEFFYPPRQPRLLRTSDGRLLDASQARIDVADIPYLRFRDKLLTTPAEAESGFGMAIARGQQRLDTLLDLPRLVIMHRTRCIRIGETELTLPPLEFVLYAWLARFRVQQAEAGEGDGFVTFDDLDAVRHDLLHDYARHYGLHSDRVAALRRKWQHGIPLDSGLSHFAAIKRKIRQALVQPGGSNISVKHTAVGAHRSI